MTPAVPELQHRLTVAGTTVAYRRRGSGTPLLWLHGAGGIGKTMGEWIVDGRPEWDVWPLDVRRFGRQYRSRAYTLARSYEALSQYYDIKYPGEEKQAGRPLRVSPAYARHQALAASFGEKGGWERVNWYESNAAERRVAEAARLGR